jgi:hypothetical protein
MRPGIRSRAAYHLGQIADACGREPLQRLSESDQVPEVLWLAGEALHLIDEHAR